jgi:A/G-specific adenine glycosylase
MAHADADAILAWYAAVRRDLPWRRTRDPWAILVSEVMLQQTQVARVVPYYEAFLTAFPDPGALAAAPGADVLRAWSGLGYNRRALALQAAARAVARDGWPRTVEGLTALPGVGPYTAAAVASFAFGVDAAAVDTNVRRVIERLDRRRRRPRELARRAAALLPAGRAGDWNQALMELGATVGARAGVCGVPGGVVPLARAPAPGRLERRRPQPRSRRALRGQRPLRARADRRGAGGGRAAAGRDRGRARRARAGWPGARRARRARGGRGAAALSAAGRAERAPSPTPAARPAACAPPPARCPARAAAT